MATTFRKDCKYWPNQRFVQGAKLKFLITQVERRTDATSDNVATRKGTHYAVSAQVSRV